MIDTRLAPYGALGLRVALGLMFIAHAYLKLVIFTPAGFTGFLGQVGLPGFLAWPIILAELVGGIAILVGFYGRYVSLALVPILLGALAIDRRLCGEGRRRGGEDQDCGGGGALT